MDFITTYDSKLGKILLAADHFGLTGLWFEGQKYFGAGLSEKTEIQQTEDILCAKEWLDMYFSGKNPDFTPRLHLKGTRFRQEVWRKLLEIPYGETVTYGTIASRLAEEKKMEKMSARAVGGAVGHNPVSIIVPCHRVIGASGKITGYAGGIERKKILLLMEKTN